jgi:hypothetical protein
MPDLSRALAMLRTLSVPMSPAVPVSGTGGGEPLEIGGVPAAPIVPGTIDAKRGNAQSGFSHDLLERAAILEFCAQLQREEADALALATFGVGSWEALALVHADAAD